MAYEDEAAKAQKTVNIVLKIGSEYFSTYQPDSGLVVPTKNLIVDDPLINGVTADIRRASTPVGSLTFKLKDESEYMTVKIMADENNFLEKEVVCYVGFINGSYDFADYKEMARTYIDSVTKIANGYSILSKEITSLITNPTYNVKNKLGISILLGSTTLDLQDAIAFPDSGLIKIDNEFIRYASKTDNTLAGLTRGFIGSPAAHSLGADAFLVTEIINVNPIDIILRLLLSKNGDLVNDPTYDVYKNGLGIDPNLINIAKFEEIRDLFLENDLYSLYLYNESDTLKYIEAQILQPTNCRLFADSGKISINILDQINVNSVAREVNEDQIIGVPTWKLVSDKITNVIRLFYDYDEETAKYLTTYELKNEDSIAVFGEKKPLEFRFKGIKSSLSGSVIIEKMAVQLLGRLSTPRGTVSMRGLFDISDLKIGDDIILNHRFLPQQGGALGIYDQIEIVSKSIDLKNITCSFKLEYTSFAGIRVGFIAPSLKITSITDQKTFEVDSVAAIKEGYLFRLWNNVTKEFLPDAINVIESIIGNTVIMANEFGTTLTTDLMLRFPDYEFSTSDQRARYAFIGENSGFFSDGSKVYQIIL